MSIDDTDDLSTLPSKRVRRPRQTYSPPPFKIRKGTYEEPSTAPKKKQYSNKKNQVQVAILPARYLQDLYDGVGMKRRELHFRTWFTHRCFIVDQQWTCYRCHFFRLVSSINLNVNHAHTVNGEKINSFKLSVVAKRPYYNDEIPLLYYAQKGGEAALLQPITIGNTSTVKLDRLQFMFSTQKHGENNDGHQHYFVVESQLFAELKNGERIKVATCGSNPIIVRGNSSAFDAYTNHTNHTKHIDKQNGSDSSAPSFQLAGPYNHISSNSINHSFESHLEIPQQDKNMPFPFHAQSDSLLGNYPISTLTMYEQRKSDPSTDTHQDQSYESNSYKKTQSSRPSAGDSGLKISFPSACLPKQSHRVNQNKDTLKGNTSQVVSSNKETEKMIHQKHQQDKGSRDIQYTPSNLYPFDKPLLPSEFLFPISLSSPLSQHYQKQKKMVPSPSQPLQQQQKQQQKQQQEQPRKTRPYLNIATAVSLVKHRIQRPYKAQESGSSQDKLNRSDKLELSNQHNQSNNAPLKSSRSSKLSEQQHLSGPSNVNGGTKIRKGYHHHQNGLLSNKKMARRDSTTL